MSGSVEVVEIDRAPFAMRTIRRVHHLGELERGVDAHTEFGRSGAAYRIEPTRNRHPFVCRQIGGLPRLVAAGTRAHVALAQHLKTALGAVELDAVRTTPADERRLVDRDGAAFELHHADRVVFDGAMR